MENKKLEKLRCEATRKAKPIESDWIYASAAAELLGVSRQQVNYLARIHNIPRARPEGGQARLYYRPYILEFKKIPRPVGHPVSKST